MFDMMVIQRNINSFCILDLGQRSFELDQNEELLQEEDQAFEPMLGNPEKEALIRECFQLPTDDAFLGGSNSLRNVFFFIFHFSSKK
jgi:hypothetical protein